MSNRIANHRPAAAAFRRARRVYAIPDLAAVDVTLLGRFYERFADHAVENGRRVSFQGTGETPDV